MFRRDSRIPERSSGTPDPDLRFFRVFCPEPVHHQFNTIPPHRYGRMLTRRATPEMVAAWKAASEQYRPLLCPNRKSGHEIVAYLVGKYPLRELPAESLSEVIADNVLLNDHEARKLPPGQSPEAAGFFLENSGAAGTLYENQDEIFRGKPIIVGVELTSGWFMVEGSSLLWDEIFAFRGMDEDDLTNYFLVAEYVSCLRRFGMLETVLEKSSR